MSANSARLSFQERRAKAQQRVADKDQKEEENDGGGCVEVRGDPGAVEHHVAVRNACPNGPSTGSADEESAEAGPLRGRSGHWEPLTSGIVKN